MDKRKHAVGWKWHRLAVLAALLAGLIAYAAPVGAQAPLITRRYVDSAGVCAGLAPCDATIQAAVDNAGSAPVEVYIFPGTTGTYDETVDLSGMNSANALPQGQLSLIGVSAAGVPTPGAVDVVGSGVKFSTSAPFPGLLTLSGLDITSDDDTAVNLATGPGGGVVIRNSVINASGDGIAISAQDSTSIKLDGVRVQDTGGDGAQIDLTGAGQASELIITDSTFFNNGGRGVALTADAHTVNVLLYDITIDSSAVSGLSTTFTGDTGAASSRVIMTGSPSGGSVIENTLDLPDMVGLDVDVTGDHPVSFRIDDLEVLDMGDQCATITVTNDGIDSGAPDLAMQITDSRFAGAGSDGILADVDDAVLDLTLQNTALEDNGDDGLEANSTGSGLLNLQFGDSEAVDNAGAGLDLNPADASTFNYFQFNSEPPGAAAPLVGTNGEGLNMTAVDDAVVNAIITQGNYADNSDPAQEVLFAATGNSDVVLCLFGALAQDTTNPTADFRFQVDETTANFEYVSQPGANDPSRLVFEPDVTAFTQTTAAGCTGVTAARGASVALPVSSLPLSKTASTPRSTPGAIESFTVSLTNTEDFPIVDIIVADALPGSADYISDNASASGTVYDAVAGEWRIPSLGIGQSVAFTLVAQINDNTTNTASVIQATFGTVGASGSATIIVRDEDDDDEEEEAALQVTPGAAVQAGADAGQAGGTADQSGAGQNLPQTLPNTGGRLVGTGQGWLIFAGGLVTLLLAGGLSLGVAGRRGR